jgi:hypothetical protein
MTAGWSECDVLPQLWAEDQLPPEDRGPFAIVHADGSKANAAFIAAARSAVPALLVEVERLRAERDRARELAVALEQQTAEALRIAGEWREMAALHEPSMATPDWERGNTIGINVTLDRCADDLQRVLGVPDDEEETRS